MRFIKDIFRNYFYESVSENCGLCYTNHVVHGWILLVPSIFRCNHKNNRNIREIKDSKLLVAISTGALFFLIVGTIFSLDVVDENFDKSINDIIVLSDSVASCMLTFINGLVLFSRSLRIIEHRALKAMINYSLQIPNFVMIPKRNIVICNVIALVSLIFITVVSLGFLISSFLTYATYSFKLFLKQSVWIITFYYDMGICAAYIMECGLYTILNNRINSKIKELLIEKTKYQQPFTTDDEQITYLLHYLRLLTRLRCSVYLNVRIFEAFVNPGQVFYISMGTFSLILNFFAILKIIFNESSDIFYVTTIYLQVRFLITSIVLFIVLMSVAVLSKTVSYVNYIYFLKLTNINVE